MNKDPFPIKVHKSLLSLLYEEDARNDFKPRIPNFYFKINPIPCYKRTDFVHHLLFRKSSGVYYLAIWHEITGEDTSVTPRRQIAHPDLPAVVEFSHPPSLAVCHVYDNTWNLRGKTLNVTGNSIRINIPDQVVILELESEKTWS